MAVSQAVQLFVLALAGATLAGCVQHNATEQSASLGVSPQASPAQAAPQRRACATAHRFYGILRRVILE